MKEIPLTKGKIALVDDEDYEWLMQWKWCYYGKYAGRAVGQAENRKVIYMHRLILNPPEGLDTDHIDRNKLNNQRSNLRAVTRAENSGNKDPYMRQGLLITPGVRRKRNKHQWTYIYWSDQRKKFRTVVIVEGKRRTVGQFRTYKEAEDAIRKHEGSA